MAEELTNNNDAAGLSKSVVDVAPAETVINVIPDEFYGAALRKGTVVSAPAKAAPASVVASVKPDMAGDSSMLPGIGQKKRRSRLPLVLIALAVLLAVGALASWWFFGRKIVPPSAPINPNTNTGPLVERSICGDAKCAADENYDGCPADCEPPAPTCGDGSCDALENFDNCSADCPKPAPVCGDGICASPEEDTKSCSDDCEPLPPVPASDSDSDGVTDLEETDIYGTDRFSADTDGDSFVDLNEIINLFDPAKPRPSMLLDNPGLLTLNNDDQRYRVLLPATWNSRIAGDNGEETYLTAGSGEVIQLLVVDKPTGQSLIDWYLVQVPDVKSSALQLLKTRGGYDQLWSPDRLTAYVAVNGRIVVISYDLADQTELRFRATFQMIVNSLNFE